jgi:two-component system response regulator PilR (NtrC family)
MLALNCAALPETLFEAELFGTVRGAYTGADRDRAGLFGMAHGGTLFLDEIGDMARPMQAKLLRTLEDRRIRPLGSASEIEVDVRVVAATHRDLGRLVDRGEFRADLLHRLAVLEVRVPPLRERIVDLRPLVAALAPSLARDTGLGLPRVEDDAWRTLESYSWPGNVRELRAVLARAMLRAGSSPVRAVHIAELRHGGAGGAGDGGPDASLERRMIADALREAGGVVRRAALDIGWSRQKLSRRIAALGIDRGAG